MKRTAKINQEKKTYLELGDIALLENAATCLRDKLLIRLLFRLGCRISEALWLSVDDINFDKGEVSIIHLKSRINRLCPSCNQRLSRLASFCPACGRKADQAMYQNQERRKFRVLPVDGETQQMLHTYIEGSGTILKKGKQLIFGINRHRAWQVIRDCAAKAGLPYLVNPDTGRSRGISPHRLRDAFAVHAMKLDDSGDGLRLLQKHLGHASFNTTAKYRKVAGEEHRRWYESLWEEEK